MNILKKLVVITLVLAMSGIGYAAYAADDDSSSGSSGGMGKVLTATILGGLLGGGLGTAIGSISGRAGTGALIGAGIGSVGGALVGANQADKRSDVGSVPVDEKPNLKGAKVTKRVIKEYDAEGNVVSEKEVKS